MEKGLLHKKLKTYYSQVNLHSYRKLLFEAIEKYKGEEFRRILDIGGGVGSFAEAIRPFNFEIVLLEGSSYGLKESIKKGFDARKFFLKKGNKLPFKDNSISFVLMNQIIEHIDKESGEYYIKEVHRVLEPGGVCIIKSPSSYNQIWKTDPHHVYLWKPNDLYSEVSKYVKDKKNIYQPRTVLEFWMFNKYDESIIEKWHKNVRYPLLKRIPYMIVKVIDKVLNKFVKTDRLLANSDVLFVKEK